MLHMVLIALQFGWVVATTAFVLALFVGPSAAPLVFTLGMVAWHNICRRLSWPITASVSGQASLGT